LEENTRFSSDTIEFIRSIVFVESDVAVSHRFPA